MEVPLFLGKYILANPLGATVLNPDFRARYTIFEY